jgi:hypothetical protein
LKKITQKSFFSIRLRYKRVSPLPPCHVIDKIQEELSKQQLLSGHTDGNDARLRIQNGYTNILSPQFDIQVRKRGKGSYISGVLVADSKLWTVYIFLLVSAVVLFFLGILMFIYKWAFQIEQQIAWVVPTGFALVILAMALCKFGQFKAKNQIDQLWRFFDDAIDAREKKQRELLNELFPGEDIMI